MWNYLFFLAYLSKKDPNEFTGIESYIQEKIENNDLNWFPFNKARELKDFIADDDLAELKQVDVLN